MHLGTHFLMVFSRRMTNNNIFYQKAEKEFIRGKPKPRIFLVRILSILHAIKKKVDIDTQFVKEDAHFQY